MDRRGRITAEAHRPVFCDPGGRRWRRIRRTAAVLLWTLTLVVVGLAPQALSPTWAATRNHDATFPSRVTGPGRGPLPVVGDGVFTRVSRILRAGGRVYLADPFDDTVYRAATADELAPIGVHDYVREEFGVPAPGRLALTFDDGPDAVYTPALLDLLARNGVPATFFQTGANVVRHSELTRRAVREGHTVGSHTFTHVDLRRHGTSRNREELIGTDRVLRAAAGYSSRLFRVPYGDEAANLTGILQAQQMGYLHVGFDLDTGDWQYNAGERVPLPPLDGRGHVVLLHDGGGNRAPMLALVQRLIDDARAAGYTFGSVDELVPDRYRPVTMTVPPAWPDRATWTAARAALVVPGLLVGWLYWFGLGALVVVSGWYMVLAVVAHRRGGRRRRHDATPSVTVVLAAYNEEPVIARTLAGIAATRYPDLEVIAVNDGSTDGTLDVLTDTARRWPALRVLDQPNRGKAAALNAGFAAARGEVVVTLDADTLIQPDTVPALAGHFGDPRVGAVAAHVKVGNRRNLLTALQSLEYLTGICVARVAEGQLGAIMIAPGACAAWRREAVLAAGGWSEDTLAEDCDLTLTMHRHGYRIRQDNDAVAWTEAPMTMTALARQRLRWTFGNLQAYHKHRSMVLRPRYGWLGLVGMPLTLFSIAVQALFLPVVYVTTMLLLIGGSWRSLAAFAVLVTGVQVAITVTALVTVRERTWHLLVVPMYRVVYEPLRVYLLYAALLRALTGRAQRWYRPERTATVTVAASSAVPFRTPS